MSELLRMEHISKRFGNFYANKDISLSVNRGEVLTLLGENGAGKSTLMNILIGLYQPTEGKIFLEGKEVRIDSPSQAVKLGIGSLLGLRPELRAETGRVHALRAVPRGGPPRGALEMRR